jgi:hypothetical protein
LSASIVASASASVAATESIVSSPPTFEQQSCPPPDDRRRFEKALIQANVIRNDLALTHLSHTCDLTIDRATHPVLDVRQIIPHMNAPRGINQIVVLDAELRLVMAIRYSDERPLNCEGPRLSVFGELGVESDGKISRGDLLVFSRGGASVRAETINSSEGKPQSESE